MSISNRFLFEQITAPDDNDTTLNATRKKRELQQETTTVTQLDMDVTKTTELPNISHTIANESNEIDEQIEMNASIETTRPTDSSTNNSYPNFHVTYWMFYPYSQVNNVQWCQNHISNKNKK